MSTSAQPTKFFVPELPLEYVGDFGPHSETAEARLSKILLDDGNDALPNRAFVIKGMGGSGKTVALLALGNRPEVMYRFSDAVWFVSLGRDARPSSLLENLEAVIRSVVGHYEAEEIGRLSKLENNTSAVAEAVRLLDERPVLLLFDDVWVDVEENAVGQTTVFSLVRDCLRRIQRRSGLLTVVVSSRDSTLAGLVSERGRVCIEPYHAHQAIARHMLCSYAGVPYDEIEKSSLSVRHQFEAVLDRCAGLPLALAVAGSAAREWSDFAGTPVSDVWCLYLNELERNKAFLQHSVADHDSIFGMIRSSLGSVKTYLKKTGFVRHGDVDVLFSYLAVLPKQDMVPLCVLECVLGMGSEETSQFCIVLSRMHLIRVGRLNGEICVSVHDVILDYSAISIAAVSGLRAFVSSETVNGLGNKFLLKDSSESRDYQGHEWWALRSDGPFRGALEYCRRNIFRHSVDAGGESIYNLLNLVSDYRWIEAQVRWSKNGNDLSTFIDDLRTLLRGFEKEMGGDLKEHTRTGIELILDAARLSTSYVAENPRELAYQLYGRLNHRAGQSTVVGRLFCSLSMYAPTPWLKVGEGVLKAAGGPVILKATLSHDLLCMCLLPSGEDVVVGGRNGYLVVFSVRYASVVQHFHGHTGSVNCVAVCSKKNRIWSGGSNGTIRNWNIGTNDETCEPLVVHCRAITSLLVTVDGSKIVFGDEGGWLTVCNANTGVVEITWRGHELSVLSLVVHGSYEMVISCSSDGTIGKWTPTTGQEIGGRLLLGGGRIHDLEVSLDGSRIAFAAAEKVGIINTVSGNVLCESYTQWSAYCIHFDSEEETIIFGMGNGTTAVLNPDGLVVSGVRAHSDAVLGVAKNSDKSMLISISGDYTLCVQAFDRIPKSGTEESSERYDLSQFVVLPDRVHVLYSWFNGPRGLKLLRTTDVPRQAAVSQTDLENLSVTVGSASDFVTAIAVCHKYAVAGTEGGEILVYDVNVWRKRYSFNHRLLGAVWSVAICNDSCFVAAGSNRGGVVLFRLHDGSELPLLSSADIKGKVVKLVFSEDCSTLIVLSRVTSRPTGKLHVFHNIGKPQGIVHTAREFNKVSKWTQPTLSFAVIANDRYIATKDLSDTEVCIYDMTMDCYPVAPDLDLETSRLLYSSLRKNNVCTGDGLFMLPTGRTIWFGNGSRRRSMGTLECPVFNSFRPDHWTFDSDTGLFFAGGMNDGIVRGILVSEQGSLGEDVTSPELPSVHISPSRISTGRTGPSYSVFISHAGPDKRDVALPLYSQLETRNICTFVDKEELRPGQRAGKKMDSAMQSAEVGVFILSPEFACRQWPMKELSCFLTRIEEAEAEGKEPPIVIPVFYRLSVRECRSETLYSDSKVGPTALAAGFFLPGRQKKMSVEKAVKCLKTLSEFMGIENNERVVNAVECEEDERINRMRRDRLVDKITVAVIEAQTRREKSMVS